MFLPLAEAAVAAAVVLPLSNSHSNDSVGAALVDSHWTEGGMQWHVTLVGMSSFSAHSS